MTKEQKVQVVAELTDKLNDYGHFYLTDTSGLSVAEINKFRKMCFDQDIEYKVYKNTMIKKALDISEVDYSELDDALKGFSGVMFVKEIANRPAKVIKKFRKEIPTDKPKFKAASIDTDIFIGENYLDTLSDLKSKPELIGEVISLLQSPAKNVISMLQSGEQKLAGIVKTLSERGE